MTRILGLDYGDKNVGVAVSDGLGLTAQPLEIIRREDEKSIKKTVKRLSELIKQYEVSQIILGHPKNMDNSEGFRCEKTKLFKERLERNFKKTPIVLWDERLSTIAVDRVLTHTNNEKRDEVVDKMAAVFILQGYLDYLNNKKNKL